MNELKNIDSEAFILTKLRVDKILEDEIVEKYIDTHSEIISMNENIDIDFVRKWKEKLDWRILSINYQFTESELLEFFGSIHWKSAVYCQKECTKEFISDNKLDYVIIELQKYNVDVITKANAEYGHINNELIISVNNENSYSILLTRINMYAYYTSDRTLDLFFDNGDVYHIPTDNLYELKRDLQISIVECDDVIEAIRDTAERYCCNSNKLLDN